MKVLIFLSFLALATSVQAGDDPNILKMPDRGKKDVTPTPPAGGKPDVLKFPEGCDTAELARIGREALLREVSQTRVFTDQPSQIKAAIEPIYMELARLNLLNQQIGKSNPLEYHRQCNLAGPKIDKMITDHAAVLSRAGITVDRVNRGGLPMVASTVKLLTMQSRLQVLITRFVPQILTMLKADYDTEPHRQDAILGAYHEIANGLQLSDFEKILPEIQKEFNIQRPLRARFAVQMTTSVARATNAYPDVFGTFLRDFMAFIENNPNVDYRQEMLTNLYPFTALLLSVYGDGTQTPAWLK